MNSLKSLRITIRRGIHMSSMQRGSDLGSGAGRGGGGGGSVREAGGSFGRKEAAIEEQYFRKLQAEQLHKLKEHVHDEITFHEKKIKEHQEALKQAKESLEKMEKK